MDLFSLGVGLITGSLVTAFVAIKLNDDGGRHSVWRACQDHQAELYYMEHDPENKTRWKEMLADQHEQPCQWGVKIGSRFV